MQKAEAIGTQTVLVAAALVAFLAIGISGIGLGWGTDRDSIRVVQSASAILAGHYQRSRSFGFPLHEAATALLYACGGLAAANLGSVIVTTMGIGAALRVAQGLSADRVWLACLTLCTLPMLLVNANVAIDFGWSFATCMVVLMAALRLSAAVSAGEIIGFGAAALIAVLVRPDNAVFVAAVTAALLWRRPAGRLRIIAAVLAAGGAAVGIYLGLNGFHVLLTGVATTRPLAARLARAAVCGTASLGFGGLLALGLLSLQPGSDMAPVALIRRTVLFAWLLYVPRFILLPDQADYLIVPVATSLLLAVSVLPLRSAMACMVLSAVPSVLTVSFFWRDSDNGALRFGLALQSGDVAQDRAARRFAMTMERRETAAFVSARLAGTGAPKSLTYGTYMPGFTSPAGDLVIGEAQLYRVLPIGAGLANLATLSRGAYAAIWACDAALAPGIGWRGWEAPVSDRIVSIVQSGGDLKCRRVSGTSQAVPQANE